MYLDIIGEHWKEIKIDAVKRLTHHQHLQLICGKMYFQGLGHQCCAHFFYIDMVFLDGLGLFSQHSVVLHDDAQSGARMDSHQNHHLLDG